MIGSTLVKRKIRETGKNFLDTRFFGSGPPLLPFLNNRSPGVQGALGPPGLGVQGDAFPLGGRRYRNKSFYPT